MKTRDIIALSMVKGIGDAFIKKNLNQIVLSPSLDDYISAANIELDEVSEIDHLLERADNILKECRDKGYKVLNLSENEYPASLKVISDPPAVLYMLGNTDLLNNVIAIVGTRESTTLGERIAERLGEHFSKYFSICNGLVEGIDKHSICIDGQFIPNAIGVISGGLNYTETCTSVHAKIIRGVIDAGGLIISPFEPNQKEDQFSGSKVSRIQAGLSSGLILVQSSVNGGSKYTVKSFSKLGRTIGVVHYPSNDEYKAKDFGANHLMVEKGLNGVAEFIGQKTTKGINVKAIISIGGQKDYKTFNDKITGSGEKESLW